MVISGIRLGLGHDNADPDYIRHSARDLRVLCCMHDLKMCWCAAGTDCSNCVCSSTVQWVPGALLCEKLGVENVCLQAVCFMISYVDRGMQGVLQAVPGDEVLGADDGAEHHWVSRGFTRCELSHIAT